jgi:formate hydrogenlyase transcriptional activator
MMATISAMAVDISASLPYAPRRSKNMREQKANLSESLRFHSLVQGITARLVSARGEEIDAAVDDCLARMGEHFGVETVSLGGITKSGQLTPALRVWGRLPPRDKSLGLNPAPGPEMVAQLCREGSFVYSRLEDLDEFPQYLEHTRGMGVAAAVFWLHRDLGSHMDGMAIGSTQPRAWPEDIVEHLGVIGEVLYNAMYRRRAEMETERLLLFEQVVAKAASNFVHVPPERVDEEIDKTLGRICECVDADLSTLVQWEDPEKSTLTVSHEWRTGSVGGPSFRGDILSDDYPWLAARLREEELLLISDLDDFPPEAAAERETCERIGIQSIMWAPFVATHGLQGYITLSTVDRPGPWLEGIVPQLGLVGNVFASAIARRRADLDLQQAYVEIRQLKEHLEAENVTLREEIETSVQDEELIGKNYTFQTILHQVEQVAGTDSTVLILGDTGTGKGLIARRIHRQSGRKDRPMVTVNCAALPAALIESELFGHEKGAFTGAVDRKIGRFELADGGTIFLDEVGDLPLELQAKLLRVLQDREFERLGSSETKSVDTRVIAATNRDLDKLIEQEAFRTDLYYRLGVFPIRMPSLRERRDDIPLLVWFFITNLQTRLGKTFDTVPPRVMDALIAYDWPGNVRELRNIIERAMILSPGPRLDLRGVMPARRTAKATSTRTGERPDASLEEIERAHIVRVLEECGWRVRGKDGAAERLRLKRSTLQSRMKKLGIQRPTA